MNELQTRSRLTDWETVGFHTMFECNDEARAVEICGLQLHSYADQLRPGTTSLETKIKHHRNSAAALQAYLYDGPISVNDASMVRHTLLIRIVLGLVLLTALTSVVSNFAMFSLMAWGTIGSAVAAVILMALPLALGHPVYEKLLSGHQGLQVAIIVVMAVLGGDAVYQFGQARRAVMDQASEQTVTRSYVDGDIVGDPTVQATHSDREAGVKGTLGGAFLMMSLAAELALGFLTGLFVQVRTDVNYAAWRKLKQLLDLILQIEEQVTERYSRIEIAKKQCMAGIRRAQTLMSKRHVPYYKVLAILVLFTAVHVPLFHAQSVEHVEGILIDTSGSISRGGTTGDLFKQFLHSTKYLLATELPSSHIWVSSIASDSFGGVNDITDGWTPPSRGIFTADVDRARQQLATSFEGKSGALTATAPGTDIFGGLWHLKAMIESVRTDRVPTRTLWIFSDMMNETPEFPMPKLLEIGPERMIERAKVGGFLVPLPHYTIYVYGASTRGLTPRSWLTIKRFWELYFAAAGAHLLTYSPGCDAIRPR